MDELGSIPAHGRDRQRYCRLVVQDAQPLAGSICLFLLDPEVWNEAALDAQMRALPVPRRRPRPTGPAKALKQASKKRDGGRRTRSKIDARKQTSTGAAEADAAAEHAVGDAPVELEDGDEGGQEADAAEAPRPEIKPVRTRMFQQRLEDRRRKRRGDLD